MATREQLIPSASLFRFAIPCQFSTQKWAARGFDLGDEYRIPSLAADLDEGPRFADLRLAWSERGLLVQLRVQGKQKSLWCRESRLDESDGLSIWIDTRDMHSVHRAGRFCHRFVFLPQGAGRMLEQPVAQLVEIPRAREHPRPAPPDSMRIRSEKRVDGYLIQAFIHARAISGYDPQEHQRLGFYYAVVDRELGWQTFSLSAEFPFMSDPSLWGTLELVR